MSTALVSREISVQSNIGRRRFIIALEAVGLTISLLTLAAAIEAFRFGAVQFEKEARICKRCGIQTITTSYSASYLHLTTSRICSAPLIAFGNDGCLHDPEVIGTRCWSLGFEKWRRYRTIDGFPDGDDLFQSRNLIKAVAAIAKSNPYLAGFLIRDLCRLRKGNSDVGKILPALQSRNTEELIAELKGYDFYNAVILAPK